MKGRLLAGLLTAALLVTMSGCQKEEAGETEETVMGRYLEEEVPLPEGLAGIVDAAMLEDGSLGLLGYQDDYLARFWISSDGGENWEEQGDMPQELGLGTDTQSVVELGAIRQDGSILCMVTTYQQPEDEESFDVETSSVFQLRNTDGSYQQLDIQLPEELMQGIAAEWISDSSILLQDSVTGLYEINLENGSVEKNYVEEEGRISTFGVVENHLIVSSEGKIEYYDLDSRKPETEDAALSEQIKNSGADSSLTSYGVYPLLICQSGEEGQMLYCDSTGIYSHVIGGNAMEQVVDGKLNSMGDPSVGLKCMFPGADDTIYLAVTTESGSKLLRYVYSKDTPAVPSKEIKVYSLEENEELQQAISLFQKENPDCYISLETGLGEDQSATVTDALKTLNTEIMAGKGPDLLVLDGMPVASYEEKGMLADISSVIEAVDEDEGILDNIQEAYTKDGKIYSFPGRFSIPLVIGPKEQVSNLQTMDGLAAAAKEKAAGGTGRRFFSDMNASLLSEGLLDGAYPAWIQDDGTLDEELVTEYFRQVKEIYDADSHAEEIEEQIMSENYSHMQMSYIEGTMLQVYGQETTAAVGNLSSASGFSQLTSAIASSEETELDYALWNGQEEGCFSPFMVMGINSKSKHQEEAAQFLEFLFRQEAQSLSMGFGLPVNDTVYHDEEYWNAGDGMSIGYTATDGEGVVRQVTLDVTSPSAEQIQKIQKMGESLTVPSALDRNVVETVHSELENYVKGESSLEEAIQSLMQKVNLYLAE